MTRLRSAITSDWYALRSAAVERMGEDEVRWRSLGGLFVAGGLLALAMIALPVAPGAQRWPIAGLGIAAIAIGTAMMAFPRLIPRGDRWMSLSLGGGTLLVTAGVHFTRAAVSPLALLYLWVALDAFFFLSRRSALRHIVFVGIAYGTVLATMPSSDTTAIGRWVMTMGTVCAVGALADILRERSDRLIERLGEAASTDPLTGLWNRRGFERLMTAELARAERSGEPLSLLIGDLDHFKTVNDRFGHGEGDAVLQRFSALVRAVMRQSDASARIGGEEFAMILPATGQHQAYVIAERLRRQVRETLVPQGQVMSISFGIASSPLQGTTLEELVHHADRALYVAKHLGRDRSVIYNADVDLSVERGGAFTAPEQLSAVLVLAETMDLRDNGTALHSQTVGRYTEAVALRLGLAAPHVERIRLAGLLHDVGKIGVPDNVLRKPGPLDDAEWAEMRKHPELGARMLAGANLDDISEWVLAHHERPDGRGYPAGLSAGEISLEARILAVADAFEAMTGERVYRDAMAFDEAIAELRRHAGTQFDAAIVEALIAALPVLQDAGGGTRTPTALTTRT